MTSHTRTNVQSIEQAKHIIYPVRQAAQNPEGGVPLGAFLEDVTRKGESIGSAPEGAQYWQ